jgi:hypothetical protein
MRAKEVEKKNYNNVSSIKAGEKESTVRDKKKC